MSFAGACASEGFDFPAGTGNCACIDASERDEGLLWDQEVCVDDPGGEESDEAESTTSGDADSAGDEPDRGDQSSVAGDAGDAGGDRDEAESDEDGDEG